MNITLHALKSTVVSRLHKASALAILLVSCGVHAEEAGNRTGGQVFNNDTALGQVWINDVGTLLDLDHDRDGFFSRFAVSVDADVSNEHDFYGDTDAEARVFARISLTDESGLERLVYDSNNFDIYGRNGSDRYRIELDLRDAFVPSFYDVVVELRDARRDRLLDVVDARDFRTLGGLPLEDAFRDGRVADDGFNDTFVAVEYSGASGPLTLLGIVVFWLLRQGRTRPARLKRRGRRMATSIY